MRRQPIALALLSAVSILSIPVGAQVSRVGGAGGSRPAGRALRAPRVADLEYFPPTTAGDDTWETEDPLALGWDASALDALRSFLDASGTHAFVVLHGGRILIEEYFDGWDRHTTQPIFSCTKSLTATQIGMLQARGLLDVAAPMSDYLGAGWSTATPEQELAITIGDVLTMSSGLDDDFGYAAAPGALWRYNTPVYRLLLSVIEAASSQTRSQFGDANLWTPIGMHDTTYAAAGNFCRSSARDLARFGLLVRNDCVWDGSQTLLADSDYVDAMRTPSQALNPAYGLLWWINGQSAWILPDGSSGLGPLLEDAPLDLYAALGALDQKVYVVPSLDLVVTRLGEGAGPPTVFDNALWQRILAAAP